MSKVNAIRKKALDYVRKQDWQNAIKEYKRLADLDQSNPNVFNELGDIYLKTGDKSDAYDSFTRAIDSYTRVSLHNNAVAVCKKVLRLIPSRYDVLIKLGLIRKKQGLAKEAESYYFSYLEKSLVDEKITQADVKKSCAEIIAEMEDSIPVLERVYECMIKFNLKEETGGALQSLYALYAREGNQAEMARTQERMGEIGVTPDDVQPVDVGAERKDGVVITEDNIWSETHTDGERIEIGEAPAQQDGLTPIGVPRGPEETETPESPYEYGNLQAGGSQQPGAQENPAADGDPLGGGPLPAAGGPSSVEAPTAGEGGTPESTTQTIPMPDGTEPHASGAQTDNSPQMGEDADGQAGAGVGAPTHDPDTGAPVYDISSDPAADAAESTGRGAAPTVPEGGEPSLAGLSTEPHGREESDKKESASDIRVSAIMDDLSHEGGGELTEEDYRSHYDLGMAYLEMDLLAEAIREYQFASKSPTYQARALEMIGLCFLKQNQAHLAIKQLTKGLQMIGDDDSEALGIKYNLGLAYEMVGDIEKAKSAFEDVYVEDVTFRDVTEKIEKYS